MLDLFKGQISIDDLKAMTYKEAYMLRTIRIDRKMKEREKSSPIENAISELENSM